MGRGPASALPNIGHSTHAHLIARANDPLNVSSAGEETGLRAAGGYDGVECALRPEHLHCVEWVNARWPASFRPVLPVSDTTQEYRGERHEPLQRTDPEPEPLHLRQLRGQGRKKRTA